ncbi:hypothetical protein JOF53_003489 [Crossiella equi]|uniref:Uncharacterized protein n=1 Tax=Crossiella equi TaxID=130796 RepID=A0ABS5AEE1_9PSEU|nr:hypothetical protein [Crossiella equi]
MTDWPIEDRHVALGPALAEAELAASGTTRG